jgi:phosphatidylglycerol:prolipoprotein diacylglycerol transferase
MRPTVFTLPWFDIPIRSYGLMLMIGFLGGTWWAMRRAQRTKCDPDLVVNLAFISLLSSVIGARIFYVLHYWDEHFAGRSFWDVVNITAGGLEFYGGFIGAFVAGSIYLYLKKVSYRLYADICAPSIMFGMSMARIGCFLNGCCWGGPCPAEIPWSVQFPYSSSAYQREWTERLVTTPAELVFVDSIGRVAYPLPREWIQEAIEQQKKTGAVAVQAQRFGMTPQQLAELADQQQFRTIPLHPAQLYASVDGMLLAILLNTYFYRRKRHGTVFAMMLMLYPIMRVIEETIRVDNPQDTAGMTISQFVSIVIFAVGLGMYLYLRTLPLRSPAAVPYVPPWEEKKAGAKGKAKG